MIGLVTAALAGGYFYSDSGIVASGRGGAFVAGADTQFAQYYNPAGLIHIQHPTLNIGFSAVQQHKSFTRFDEDGQPLEPVENRAPPFTVPQLGFAAPLIRDKLVFAFGMVSPFAPSSDYDPLGEQRYSIIDSSIYQFSWGPSLAWRPSRFLTIGVGLQAKVLILGQELAVSTSGQTDPSGDFRVEAEVADLFTPNFNFGVLIDPVEQVTIGLAVQPPTAFRARGRATLDFSDAGIAGVLDRPVYQDGGCVLQTAEEGPCAAEDGIELDIDLPLVLRAGVAVRPVPELEIEGAVVWQNWSTLEEITLRDVDPELVAFGEVQEIDSEFTLPAGLQSTTSLRLGAEWRVDDQVELRAGGFWESAGVRPGALNISLYDPAKVQVGGGWSIFPVDGRVRIDGSVAGIFFPSRTLTDSEVELVYVDVLGLGGEASVIGNGEYRSTGWLVGLQASYVFKGKE